VEDDAGEGLAPPPDDRPGEDLGPPDDDLGPPPTDPTTPLPPPGATSPESIWLSSTARADLPPPPPPRGSRARAGLLAALLLLLAGAAVGVVIAISAGGKGVKAASTPSPAPSPSLVPPTGFAANPDPFSVTLTWTQPSGGSPIQTYDIYRNDTLVDEIDAGTTTYTDQSVSPGRKYTYELRATANDLQTGFVSVVVKTPKPPLFQARVAGDFNVRFKFVSASGFTKTSGSFTAGWSFKPKCSDGPCDVKWSDLGEKTLKATLDRKGLKYTGQDDGLFFATCGSHQVTSHLVIAFTVTKAKGIDGEWRATAIKGTVNHSAASQLGCVSSTATLSITGNLLS